MNGYANMRTTYKRQENHYEYELESYDSAAKNCPDH